MKSRASRVLWILAAFLLIIAGGIILWLSTQPYGVVEPFLNSFFDKKGFEALDSTNFPVFTWIFRFVGVGLWAGASILLFWRRQAWRNALQFATRLPDDFTAFIRDLQPARPDLGLLFLLLLIFAAGFIFRLEFINQPMSHDESYSYVAFASGSFQTAISDYHLPNNHVFHTILIYLTTRLFGLQPWTVRLPALAAGLAIVLVVYKLAAKLYDRPIALVTAALSAYIPALIYYSTSARGYTLVALIFLLSLWLGSYLLEHKNRVAWGVLSLLSAIGFYTVPVMLFPFGVVFAWLFLSHLFSKSPQPYSSKLEFSLYLAVSGIATAILTLLAYMPIFLRSGFSLVFGNEFVASLSWRDFPATILSRFQETWQQWTGPLPAVLVWILIAGFFISFVIEMRVGRSRFPLQVAALVWIGALLVLRRPNAFEKVWVFLVPVVLMWTAAGILGLVELLFRRFPAGRRLPPLVAGCVLLFVFVTAVQVAPALPADLAQKGGVEQAADYLVDHLQDQDKYLVSFPDNAALWYYVMARGQSFTRFQPELGFKRVLAVVSTDEGQTLDSVARDRHVLLSGLNCGDLMPVQTFDTIQVFECTPRQVTGSP